MSSRSHRRLMLLSRVGGTGARRGRPASRRREWFRPLVQLLEDRTLLSGFYNLSAVASTAGGTFTGLGNLVSVSNSGDVAFVGSTGSGVFGDSGLYVEKAGTTNVVNVNPTFSSDPSRSFGQEAAINDDDLITARDQVATSPAQFLVRQWNAAQLNSSIILSHIPTTTTGSPDSQYSGLQDFTDINDAGDMAFVALSADGADRSVQFVSGSDAGLDTYQTIEQMPGSTLPTPRPQLTDTGQVLYYSTADNAIKLVDLSSRQVTVIAQVGVGGFTSLGSAPGVSFDGQIVVFEGNKGNGSWDRSQIRQRFRSFGEQRSGFLFRARRMRPFSCLSCSRDDGHLMDSARDSCSQRVE